MTTSATLRPLPQRAAVFVAALFPMSLPAIIVGRTAVAVVLIVALLTTLGLLLCDPESRQRFLEEAKSTCKHPLSLLVLLTAVLWLPSALNSVDTWQSLSTHLRSVFFVAAVVPFWMLLVRDSRLFDVCLKALCASCLILGFFAIAGLLGWENIVRYLRFSPDSPLSISRILKESASAAAVILPLLVWSFIRLENRWRAVAIGAIAVMLALIFLTASRSAVAGLLAAGIVGCMFLAAGRLSLRLKVATAFFMSAIVIGGLLWVHADRMKYEEYYSDTDWPLPSWLIDPPRQAIWSYSIEAAEADIWLGVGINTIDQLPGANDWNRKTGTRNIPLHPHNWVVEVLVETGVIGLASLLAVIAVFLGRSLRRYAIGHAGGLLAVAGVWGAYWGSGLFNFSYWSAWWQLEFYVATTICLAGASLSFRQENVPSTD